MTALSVDIGLGSSGIWTGSLEEMRCCNFQQLAFVEIPMFHWPRHGTATKVSSSSPGLNGAQL